MQPQARSNEAARFHVLMLSDCSALNKRIRKAQSHGGALRWNASDYSGIYLVNPNLPLVEFGICIAIESFRTTGREGVLRIPSPCHIPGLS